MNFLKPYNYHITRTLITLCLILSTSVIMAQKKTSFGIHADPVISWFSSDIKEVENDGARPGFNFGLTINRYFAPNYSFSTGISLLSCGGRLVSSETTVLEFADFNATVLPGNPVTYKIQYLSIPLGLKLQTNQIGYLTFFTDLGLDPKAVIGGKIDVPSLDITDEKAGSELNSFNLSYHISGGIEYSLGGTTALILGLSFENNFLDITEENGDQIKDIISHKLIGFRIGINF
jgi:hypothetical protein